MQFLPVDGHLSHLSLRAFFCLQLLLISACCQYVRLIGRTNRFVVKVNSEWSVKMAEFPSAASKTCLSIVAFPMASRFPMAVLWCSGYIYAWHPSTGINTYSLSLSISYKREWVHALMIPIQRLCEPIYLINRPTTAATASSMAISGDCSLHNRTDTNLIRWY